MKNLKIASILFLFFLSITLESSCQKKSEGIVILSSDSLNSILKSSHGILLDVRTPEEFSEGHIPGAINIDYHDENFSAALDTLDKSKSYEVYCRSGNRSGDAVEIMQKKGFKNLSHLEGGMLEWEKKGFEIIK